MSISIPVVLAGLMGASGVGLAAAGAHAAPGTGVDSAAHMLLFHALAVIAADVLSDSGRLWPGLARLATAGWLIGGALFAGDIALRALAGHRLFPMAAPTGGMLLIASWLAFALAAVRPAK
jgi:uncharacterized membrane protein YgdD (TMEM256/DUF423 family)